MAQNRRARKGAERLPRPRQRRLFCGVSIPCAAIYVSRLLVMGLPFWLLHDMLQRLAVERNSRAWAKPQVGVVFASYGVSLRLYRRRYAGYGEKHFALAERGRKPGGTLAHTLAPVTKAGANLHVLMGYRYPGDGTKAAIELY